MQFTGIIKNFRLIVILLACGLLLSCGSKVNGGPGFLGSDECPGGCDSSGGTGDQSPNPNEGEDNGSGGGNGNGAEDTGPQSLDDFIAGLSIPGEGSNAFQAPSEDKRSQFYQLIGNFLAGDTNGQDDALSALGYETESLSVDGEEDVVIALKETGSGTGGGTYLFHQQSSSDLILEVPHPAFDTNTLEQGAFLLKSLSVKALFIAGTHRCANDEASTCSGTTDACDGSFRISDVAHSTENLFQEAHKAAHDNDPTHKFVSLHGFDQEEGEPEAILSNGTETVVGFLAYVNKLATEIEEQLSGEQFTVSCNGAGEPDFGLCGTTNVQGRYTNGSSDPCQEAATSHTGRFIHLEQSSALRQDSSAWTLIQNALEDVF